MFGDLTEERGPHDVLSSFKQFLKKEDAPGGDLELHHCKSLPSTSGSPQELAVCVRDAHKRYGFRKKATVVLDGLNMTVFKGTIYALLGASGCGKTTLLSCILGCRRLNSGEIWILGGSPGSKSCGIPGPRVGYMPQCTALYKDLTINETMLFYGWVAGMTSEKIQERRDYLKQLFMLTDNTSLVGTLSGGQQRRLSLASALLHEPEVLILDEPTVGLDPLLRETIWQHFVDIVGGNTTIILTTHYIEEARQAHIVGLMRSGCLLAEEPPKNLIARYSATTLEEVFLQLSARQNEKHHFCVDTKTGESNQQCLTAANIKDDTVLNHDNSLSCAEEMFNFPRNEDLDIKALPEIPPQDKYNSKYSDYLPRIKGNNLKALIWRGFRWIARNYMAILITVFLPITQVPIFCMAIGHNPVDLQVAVVNHETNNTVNCNSSLTCHSSQLSCCYFKYLEEKGLILKYYDSEDEARQSVLNTTSYASMIVRQNYSAALRARLNDWYGAEPWNILASEIDVIRDTSNVQISKQLEIYFYDTILTFIQDVADSCGVNRKTVKVPVNLEKPIYGKKYPSYADLILPGQLVTLTFFMPAVLLAMVMIVERRDASYDRTFVIGISEIELLSAQMVCQLIPMVCQAGMSIVCAFFVFNMTQRGSYWIIAAHTLLNGFAGMSYGLLISCICDREATAIFVAVSGVLSMLLMCGTVWPFEAIHPFLQPLSHILPLTTATTGLRSILQKGWGFSSDVVYMSFVYLGSWAAFFLITSVLFLKYKKGYL